MKAPNPFQGKMGQKKNLVPRTRNILRGKIKRVEGTHLEKNLKELSTKKGNPNMEEKFFNKGR